MVNAKKAKKTKDDDIDSLRQVPLHLSEGNNENTKRR